MRIAVIDHIGNPGGGSRFIRALLPALRRARPSVEISYFGNPSSIRRECLIEEFMPHGISVTGLRSLQLSNSGIFNFGATARVAKYLQARFFMHLPLLPYSISGNLKRELEHMLQGYDLAYFPWPFFITVPALDCPMVATFHDVNFKYYFSGTATFGRDQSERLNFEIPSWLENTSPIVSTNFMADELAKFYPDIKDKLRVAHLAPMSVETTFSESEARSIVASLGLDRPYVLCPTHMCSHKNVGPLITAISRLRARGMELILVLTGMDTDRVVGVASEAGVQLDLPHPNVVGLGYVSNLQMDCLIQCASVVVTPSLYEAGNGPGVDAWIRGTPVAMSRIPAFTEHLTVQGVRAQLFDPHSPDEIASSIEFILEDQVRAAEDARVSREAMGKLTWEATALKYLSVFDAAISKTPNVERLPPASKLEENEL